jgi:hypothetical protein
MAEEDPIAEAAGELIAAEEVIVPLVPALAELGPA